MKKCHCCKKELEDSEFAKHTRPSGKIDLQNDCKKCDSLNRGNYQKEHKKETTGTKRKRRDVVREFINQYKSKHFCIICKENDPIVLDFHHRNMEDKELEVGNAVKDGWSIEKIKKEIDKCDLLCANCHRREHYKRKHATIV